MTWNESGFADWKVFAGMLIAILICYSSVIIIPYGFYDDYFVLRDVSIEHGSLTRDEMIAAGRPAQALLTQIVFAPISSPANLRYLRLVAVVLIAALAFALYRNFLYAGWKLHWAVCTSLIIATLPPFQVYASWALAVCYPLAALISAAAFYLTEQVFHEPGSSRNIYYIFGAVVLAWLSVTIVQPALMFFWVFAAIALFSAEDTLSHIFRRMLLYGLVTCAGLLLGFATYRLGLALYGNVLPPERAHLTRHLAEKVFWFLDGPFEDSLNLVSLSPNRNRAILVAAFVAIGMVCYLGGGAVERSLKLLTTFLILPLSYLPNLLSAENWASYRTQLALTSIVVVYAVMGLQGYGRTLCHRHLDRFVTAVLSLLVCLSVSMAAYNVYTYFAIPQRTELRLIRYQLARGNLLNAREIYVIGCNWRDSVAPRVRYDEFGIPSCSQPWGLTPAVYFVVREMNAAKTALPITAVFPDGRIAPPRDAVLVDMRKLADFRP